MLQCTQGLFSIVGILRGGNIFSWKVPCLDASQAKASSSVLMSHHTSLRFSGQRKSVGSMSSTFACSAVMHIPGEKNGESVGKGGNCAIGLPTLNRSSLNSGGVAEVTGLTFHATALYFSTCVTWS